MPRPGRSSAGAAPACSPPTPHRRPRRLVLAATLVAVVVLVAACGSASDPAAAPTSGPGPTTSRAGGTTAAPPAPPPGTATPEPIDTASAPTTETAAATTPSTAGAPTVADPGGGTAAGAPRPIATTTLDLVDPTRPTVSRGTTVSSSRSLPTPVAYPSGPGGPWPLVVFAHGYRLGPPGYARFVGMLAAAGYVVAAPSFPLADEGRAGTSVDRGDLPNQPGDLSFVIDQVLAAAADPSSPLAGRVDGSRIGAVGHSDGADTVLDLGYTAGRSDGRVQAVVALAPDAVVAPGTTVGTGTPLLVEHGDADSVVPYSESVAVFAAVPSHRYLLTLIGADHLPPVAQQTAWTPVLDATVVAFLDRFVAGTAATEDAVTTPASTSANARIETAG